MIEPEPDCAAPWITDARGRRVSPRLAVPFMAKDRLDRMVSLVAKIRKELLLSEAYTHLFGLQEVERLAAACTELEKTLGEMAPAVPCSCLKTEGCEHCGGKGWLNARQIRSILNKSRSAALSAISLTPSPSGQTGAKPSAGSASP